jgi:hypothetical protein
VGAVWGSRGLERSSGLSRGGRLGAVPLVCGQGIAILLTGRLLRHGQRSCDHGPRRVARRASGRWHPLACDPLCHVPVNTCLADRWACGLPTHVGNDADARDAYLTIMPGIRRSTPVGSAHERSGAAMVHESFPEPRMGERPSADDGRHIPWRARARKMGERRGYPGAPAPISEASRSFARTGPAALSGPG